MRDLAAAIAATPDLLGGEGACGPKCGLDLVEALSAAGCRNVVVPACPRCARKAPLREAIDGMRCCAACARAAKAEQCERCGNIRPVSSRTAQGDPLCCYCTRTDPGNARACVLCGQVREVRLTGERAGICLVCRLLPDATCTSCGQRKQCHFADTATPICPACRRNAKTEPCGSCGRSKPVHARAADRSARCSSCSARTEPCSGCGKTRRVSHRAPGGRPYCSTCYRRLPEARAACSGCGTVTRLHHHGLCVGCAAPAILRAALAGADGRVRAGLEPVFTALGASAPTALVSWLSQPGTRRMLASLAAKEGPVTHEVLDALERPRAALYLRQTLTAAGALEPRDECLAAFERWLPVQLAAIGDVEESTTVRAFITWTYLRRLRARSATRHLTRGDVTGPRQTLRQITAFLTWLRTERATTLTAIVQEDLDAWFAHPNSDRLLVRGFLTWAKPRHPITAPLRMPSRPRTLARHTSLATEQRWALAHRFLHDDTVPTRERVAGLLVLLFAQPLTKIVHLKVEDVTTSKDGVRIALGSHPVLVPDPMSDLLHTLVAQRGGSGAIGRPHPNPWLLPGHAAGRPLSTQRLAQLLHPHGIHARTARNSALADLAADMPAIVLSRLLGIGIHSATNWTAHIAPDRAAYAATRY